MAARAHIDFETHSALEIRDAGLIKQIEHPSFGVWVMSWTIKDGETVLANGRWHPGEPDPVPLLQHVASGLPAVAHNNGFDRNVWNRYVRVKLCAHWPVWTIKQSDCTMARCAVIGVPEGLDFVAPVLGIAQRKDDAGSKLMKQMAKPRKVFSCPLCGGYGVDDQGIVCEICGGAGECYTWWDDAERRARLDAYCDQDTVVECEVDDKATALPAAERAVWELDQTINERGVQIDIPLVRRAQAVVQHAKAELDRRMSALTGRAVEKASQVGRLAAWINLRGIPCTTVNKGAQAELLLQAANISDAAVIEAIEIRRSASRTSTSKLDKMLSCTCADGRAYFQLHYHGAHTGRWAGRLIQLQNLMRIDEDRDGKDVEIAMSLLETTHDIVELHDLIHLIVGDVMTAIAKCMRRFVIAKPGHRLVGGDLSNIEGCVNAWLAGEEWKVKAYIEFQAKRGPDLYKLTYAQSFGVDVSEVQPLQRQIGKVEDLALGYQGSVGAFYSMSQTYQVNLYEILPIVRAAADAATWDKALWVHSLTPAFGRHGLERDVWVALKIVVDRYRKSNPNITQSWWDRQDAAIEAVSSPGSVASCLEGRIKYVSARGFLWCQLPSGRLLAYCKPGLVRKDDSFAIWEGVRYERSDFEEPAWLHFIKQPDVDYYERVRNQVLYEGYKSDRGSTKKVWGVHALYGGLQCENDVSGTARDILVGDMFRLEAAGYPLILTVHDEVLSEVPIGRGNAEEVRALLTQGESWTAGLPLAAKTWEGPRYEK
jgi:DNA polymerase